MILCSKNSIENCKLKRSVFLGVVSYLRLPTCAIFDYKNCTWVVEFVHVSPTRPAACAKRRRISRFFGQVQGFLHFFQKNSTKNCTWHRYVNMLL